MARVRLVVTIEVLDEDVEGMPIGVEEYLQQVKLEVANALESVERNNTCCVGVEEVNE